MREWLFNEANSYAAKEHELDAICDSRTAIPHDVMAAADTPGDSPERRRAPLPPQVPPPDDDGEVGAQQAASDVPSEPDIALTTEPVGSVAKMGPTRLSGTWTAVAIALGLLILLLVFILLNLQRVDINFFGAHTHLPLALVILLAVVFGSVLVFVIGAARIFQVRLRARRSGESR